MSVQTLTLETLSSVKRPTDIYRLYLDPDATYAYEQAVTAGEKDTGELLAAVEAATVTLHLRAQSQREYKAMRSAHEPSAERQKELQRLTGTDVEYAIDSETYIPAFIAACIANVSLTPEDVSKLIEDHWPDNATAELYVRCLQLCNRSTSDVLGKEFAQTAR